jgi:hypothetical protein
MMANNASDVAQNRAEKIENADTAAEAGLVGYDTLDVSYEIDANGRLREITVTTTTGGPHVEVVLGAARVDVSWAESHSVPVLEYGAGEDVLDEAFEYWKAHIDGVTVVA